MNTLELAYFAVDENIPFSAVVFMRDFISSHAFQTAWPYKCLSVLVPEISSELKGPLNEVNCNLYMLVSDPSPISTPPCVTRNFHLYVIERCCGTICLFPIGLHIFAASQTWESVGAPLPLYNSHEKPQSLIRCLVAKRSVEMVVTC